jgi:ribonucleoside-diphosphate reductase alpha subunit
MTTISMQVVKRNGSKEEVSFDKVLNRIRLAADGLEVNPALIAQRTLMRIYDGVKTSELDELAAQLSISLMTTNPDYGTLASRIAISNHHRNTSDKFTEVVHALANQTVDKTGEHTSNISKELIEICATYGDAIDAKIDYTRDYLFDYFGFKTLEKLQYLLRDTRGKTLERPQHLIMRVSLALWGSVDIGRAFETYDLLSQKFFIHATPTNFNAGTPRQQLSSCFLQAMKSDSITGIYDTLKDCALISKHAGGIGLHIHNIRAKGALIRGTNGTSNGIVPMLRNFNDTARYVDQCFTPDTLIFTSKGDKRIADIEPGDEVFTSGGSETVDETGKHYVKTDDKCFNKVLKRLEHTYSGTMYHITFSSGVTVKVTPQHPFLIKQSTGEFDYIEAEKLYIGAEAVCTVTNIATSTVSDVTLYDLEVEGTHDYTVQGAGIVHNGGGKRNGSFAIYLEPWHADVEDFLKLKLNTGSEEERCRDLFYALWIPDLFMERVEKNEKWTLFCPSEAPGLADVYGDEFKELYEKYEAEGRGRKQVDAQKLWFRVLDTQIETGTPYLLYKDAANKKSNQKNVGVIKSSNLCTEIIEYSSETETAVCNLASIALPTYVDPKKKTFDFDKLREVVKVAVRNLNRVIDINYYPTPETKTSNMRHRPVGLGVQGLADVFAMMRMPWESDKAHELNQRIFEHIYYAAVESSAEIAAHEGAYSTYIGSPMSNGQFQYDMWGITPLTEKDATLNWNALKDKVKVHGVRNSLLVAPMPTASTSQILGFNECFEPFTSNIYTRRTLAGEFIIVNKYLMKDLQKLDLWNEMMKQEIIARNGSIQGIDAIPESIQRLYKTSWEIKQKTLIDMAAQRGAFICQSQSLNLFVADPNYAKLTSMHFYAWKQGLKTGLYYLRTRAPVMAQKFTVDPDLQKAAEKSEHERVMKKYAAEEGCTMCSS